MIAALLIGLVRLLTGARMRWQGTGPELRQRIYFANHSSNLDALVIWAALPSAIRKQTRPIAAKDYWSSGLRAYLANEVLHALLIERKKVTASDNPLEQMEAALANGSSLILFPEGTRNAGPEPHAFKGGLFHLARKLPQLELVPVYLENLNRVLPKGEVLPVPMLGSITVGAPISLGAEEAKADFLERARLAVWNLRLT
ncbi:MAG TPA: lysophospholipid acyltransferase family protein [Verrucomicrobiae bacterium]